jgi:O-antigen/teichoic acid export membrane protein
VLRISRPPTAASNPPAPLRENFAATFVGNALFAASQWAVLSLIAKLGGGRMLGEYALAVAIVSPIALFSHLNLRAVLATDVAGRHSFGDYLAVRLATTALALAAVLGVVAASSYSWRLGWAIVGVGVVLSLDNLSDICYGVLQRRERMDQIARSTAARGLLSTAAVALALALNGGLLAAVAGQVVARLAVLLVYDRPKAATGGSLARSPLAVQAAIVRTALPLGLVMMLVSLSGNLPRYAIERRLGTLELGAFAAVTSFQTVGSTVINALGQAATPRLARYFNAGEARQFRGLAARLTGLAGLLGAAGVLAAWAMGRFLLGLVYRADYAAYSGLLVAAMAAAVLTYTGGALGYVITSARAFAAQAPLFALVAAASGVASWLLVPRLGLMGAILALAIAWTVQIAGELLILRHALRRRESQA